MENHAEPPFQSLPTVVWALPALIFGIEILFQAGEAGFLGGAEAVGWRTEAIRDYGVFDNVFEQMWALGVWPQEHLLRFIAYPLIQGQIVSALFVCVFLLAMGKMVGEVFSPLTVFVVFWMSALVGALAYVVVLNSPVPLIGGFPGVYGLIGAFTFIIWTRAVVNGGNQARAFGLIAILMVVQSGFAAFNGYWGNVVAEFSGFATGFLLSFVLRPGGGAWLLSRLRRR